MAVHDTRHLDRIVHFLRDKRAQDVSLSDVVALAEVTAESLTAFFETMDTAVYRELRDIASYISATKREIGALQANELKAHQIPAAGMELDAVISATEAATNTIMECAEAVMAADDADPVAYKALVDEKMMMIFEACSFQDITGQRVAKVVETLAAIEARVSRFAEAVRATDVEGFLDEREAARALRRERLLLNGPALAGTGIDQSFVDNLFDSEAKPAAKPAKKADPQAAASQDDIDALFR